jgi:hypothetical protein
LHFPALSCLPAASLMRAARYRSAPLPYLVTLEDRFYRFHNAINLKLIVNPSGFGADATNRRKACRRLVKHFRQAHAAFSYNQIQKLQQHS